MLIKTRSESSAVFLRHKHAAANPHDRRAAQTIFNDTEVGIIMKSNIKQTIDKLLAYALDNLMLDALDKTYTLNKLSSMCGIADPECSDDADYGDATLADLLSELAASVPDLDKRAVADMLMPLPHTVNYYFTDELGRNPEKARDFLFDLHALGCYASSEAANGCDGFTYYTEPKDVYSCAALLPVGEDLKYTPRVVGNRIATLESPDILTSDILARESAFVESYGGAIAKRMDGDDNYYCCDGFALTSAKVKKQVATGAVKIALLDYPVPVLAFSGIAKNTVMQSAASVIKQATEAKIPCVAAAAANDGITFYAVFASADALNGEGIISDKTDALTPCGVFATIDFSPLVPVLEKGTALSTDLFAFKPIYSSIGGVKHGQKAREVLDAAVVALYRSALAPVASCDEERAVSLADGK